jgi:hypothetical protein
VKSLNNVIEGCLTDGTQGVTVFAQLLAAIFVEEVAAFGDIARRPRRVKVFHAHRTIGPGRVFHALQTINRLVGSERQDFYLVVVDQSKSETRVALPTMKIIVGAPNSAKAAVVAVELALVLIVKQVALQTRVLDKH